MKEVRVHRLHDGPRLTIYHWPGDWDLGIDRIPGAGLILHIGPLTLVAWYR
jgi:hypothetical protein